MSFSGYVHLDVVLIKRTTDRALLLELDDRELWVPRSVVCDEGQYAEGDEDCTVSVAEWWWNKQDVS